MKLELKRIDPMRTANVGAMVYGLMMAAFAVLLSPFFLIMAFVSPGETGIAGPLMAVLFLVVYPIMGVVMGWISGFLGAAIYNFVIRWSGGLLLEFDDVSPMAGAEPT